MKITWAEYMTYRLNFIFWRARMVMQLLVIYSLWLAMFSQKQEFFGYSQSLMLTYILLASVVRTITLSTTTMDIGSIINRGDLSNLLVRPMNLFRYYLAKDTADKCLNLMFSAIELSLFLIILKPDIFLQINFGILVLFVIALFIGITLYFLFSFILGFIGFWSPDIWAPRFLSLVILEFFAGGLFPLDILPESLFKFTQMLPFTYFIYFPIKIYSGLLSEADIAQGFATGIMWCFMLWYVTQVLWVKGLKVYTSEGK